MRGYELRLAWSRDGRRFEDLWTLHKDALGTPSIERACVVAVAGGLRLYVSFVDPADGRWRIDVLEADRPERLDVRSRRPALTATAADVESVKDPVVIRHEDRWLLYASFGSRDLRAAAGPDDARHASDDPLHAGGDALSSGQLLSCTGLATSADGLAWTWEGPVLVPPRRGWDGFETRLSTVVARDGAWLALYDGIPGLADNYEERTGIATSADLRTWTRLSTDGPAFRSAHGSGSLRYACAVRFQGLDLVYFESARADGAHDLLVAEAQMSA